MAFFREIARAPVATRSCFIDRDEVRGLGLERTDEVIDVTVSGAETAKGDGLGVMIFRDISNRDGLFMDIHPDVKHAGLLHG
jgi:hypothetical protein